MRLRQLAVSLLLIAAACGGAGTPDTVATSTTGGDSAAQLSTESPDFNEAPDPTQAPDTESGSAVPAPSSDGSVAPDFTTVLADGSAFNLGEHDKPVYLVFWAEW